MEIPLGYLIYQAHRAIHSSINSALFEAGLDINIEQWSVLLELFFSEGLNQQQLADKTKKDKTTLARLINTLERNELVERRSDISDKRKKLIFATSKAWDMKEQASLIFKRINGEILRDFSQEENEAVRISIRKIIDNMNWEFEYLNLKSK